MAILTHIANLRHLHWWWESPRASPLWKAQFPVNLRTEGAVGVKIWMHSWGASTFNSCRIVGNLPGLAKLRKPKPRVIISTNRDRRLFKNKLWRGCKTIVAERVYPWAFCHKLLELFTNLDLDSGAQSDMNNKDTHASHHISQYHCVCLCAFQVYLIYATIAAATTITSSTGQHHRPIAGAVIATTSADVVSLHSFILQVLPDFVWIGEAPSESLQSSTTTCASVKLWPATPSARMTRTPMRTTARLSV